MNLRYERKKIVKKGEQSLKNLWYILKCTNIHIVKIPEEEEREKMAERGRGSRWQGRRMWNSPIPTNTSKIYLNVEQF